MDLRKPRKRISAGDRYGGPACILIFSAVLTLLSQMAVYAATGYRRDTLDAKLVSTQETAELLWIVAIVQLVALGIAWVFFLLTHFMDPGSVELNQLPDMIPAADEKPASGVMTKTLRDGTEIEFRWCWHCSIWRPPMANHCPTCHRCFLKLDHHCPWTGTCIAGHNIRYFWAMIAFFGLAGIAIPVGLVAFFASAVTHRDHVHLAVIVIGVAFAAYLVCMFGGMWIGASVMLARTVKSILNPRGASSSTQATQADHYEDVVARSYRSRGCTFLGRPCYCRQH